MSEEKGMISKEIESYDKKHEDKTMTVSEEDCGFKQVPLEERPTTESEGCCDDENCCGDENCEEPKHNMDKVDAIATSNAFLTPSKLSPTRYLKQLHQSADVKVCGILEDLQNAHKEFMEAKYELYETRAKFYSEKESWEDCKKQTGKTSDYIFKEYFQSFKEHRRLMKVREEAEFKYNQYLRVFESLK